LPLAEGPFYLFNYMDSVYLLNNSTEFSPRIFRTLQLS
jgi:hypothetical protein